MPVALAGVSLLAPPVRATPLGYIDHAAGPAARPTMYVGWGMGALSIAVCLIIAVLLLVAIFRRRTGVSFAVLENGREGVRWIYIGTGISLLALLGIIVAMLITLDTVARPASSPGLVIDVRAYDWWWRVDYRDGDGDAHITHDVSTANEIHIPVGVPVSVHLASADVIHAFWVPALAGKTQAIPGQDNRQWIEADHPGVFRGQCTQFCGVQHANMAFEVVAQSAADFARWREAQAQPAAAPTTGLAQTGRTLFMARCAGCHSVRGTEAVGAHAPDLTHLGSRRLIAAGMLPNTPENVMRWIVSAQQIKPGNAMPSFRLSSAEQLSLGAYLQTLR